MAGHVLIPLRNRRGEVIAHAIIDDGDRLLADRPWYMLKNGYAVRTETTDGKKRMRYLHREVMGLGAWKEDPVQVDHRDGNRLDCRRANLRVGPTRLNAQNRSERARRSGLPRGVHFRQDLGRFMAYGKVDRKYRYLGVYDDVEEAADVALRWRLEHMEWNDADRSSERAKRLLDKFA